MEKLVDRVLIKHQRRVLSPLKSISNATTLCSFSYAGHLFTIISDIVHPASQKTTPAAPTRAATINAISAEYQFDRTAAPF